MCGGIAAINQEGAKIIGCGIANVSDISVQGSTYTGGIAAKNAGSITSCFVATGEGTLTLNNSAASSGNSAIGGIVGINERTGGIGNDSETESNACWVGRHPDSATKTSFPDINVDTYSVQITSGYSGSRLGGVAGENLGSIYGGQDKKGPWESGSSQKIESVLTINSRVQPDGTFTYDFVLKLPDINDLETEQNKIYQYLYTSAVQITALAAPDTAYHDSYHKLWLRIA